MSHFRDRVLFNSITVMGIIINGIYGLRNTSEERKNGWMISKHLLGFLDLTFMMRFHPIEWMDVVFVFYRSQCKVMDESQTNR